MPTLRSHIDYPVRVLYNAQVMLDGDNGIASVEGVAAARTHGIEVLVTDHHLPGDTLPDAA